MAVDSSRLVARLLWVFPALLLLLTLHQAKTAVDLRQTLEEGSPAVAEVTGVFKTDRVDVTYDYVSLRVTLADGRVIEQEKMSLPHSMYPAVEGRRKVDVRVLPGAAQEIVIERIARPQWRLAAINAAMAFVALVLLSIGVYAWNRYLAREGDPANRASTRAVDA